MALNAPNCKDTQDVQFKLHDKFVAFRKCGDLRSNVKLLAVSSSRDLLFAGNPAAPELKVIIIKDVVAAKSTGKQPMARRVVLPHIPNYMSCSADGNMLAINYTQSNGTSLLLIYAVQSFMTPDIRAMYNIRLAPEDFVHAVQLLWNPVLPNSLAVVLSNGGLGMYTLKEAGNFELHSLDKSQRVKCGCWSPKGKQLVLGFPDGRLQQFKPDLTPAKTLVCPPNVHEGPFDTIAVHWLSTFQFAVIFLQHGEDCSPALYIINAPKTGTPTYINYFDICYSLNGPRNHQFHFTHVQQWNLLLVSSANGVEVGVLGTAETGDTPSWEQLTLLDEARIELPLSEATQDETFPLGFVFDTSATHQLTINEKQLPSMPMVHVLGTDGTLLTFNFLNLQPGAASVCSPPPPLMDSSGQFYALNTLLGNDEQSITAAPVAVVAKPTAAVVDSSAPAQSDISFAFTPNTVTSTPAPAKEKPAPMFAGFGNASKTAAPPPTFAAQSAPLNFASAATAKPLQTTGFGGFGAATTTLPAAAPVFGLPVAGTVPNFGNLAAPTASIAAVPPSQPNAVVATAAIATSGKPNNSKPLYTVPPTFTPVAVAPTAASAVMKPSGKLADISTREVDDVIADIMGVQISAFNEQIEQQKQQTKALLSQIESPASIKFYAKRLDDLQELNDQANDVDFELDVQGLRHALSEAYAIMAECRAKLEGYRNPDITRLMSSTSFDAAGRRILSRLQSYLAANQAQLRLAQQHIDTQWEQYQDVLRRNSKSKMHMPCLEGIYQRLTRLQNMTSDQRIKQTNIKAKLKERGLLQTSLINQENNRNRNNEAVDTLADSILSMSLNQVVETNRAKLSQEKLQSIRHLLQHHKIQIISPQRPDRVGIKSEVILETKLKAEQNKKAAAAIAKPSTAHKSTQAAAQAAAVTSVQLTKPTASKTIVASAPAISAPAPTPISSAPATALPATAAAPPPSSFSFFSGSSPFSKTTVAPVVAPATNSNSADVAKPPATLPTSSAFSFSFGQMGASPAQPALSFGGLSMTTKPPAPAPAPVGAAPSLFAGFGATPLDASKPKPVVEQPKDIQAKPLELKKEVPAPVEFKPTVVEPVKSAAEPSTGTIGATFSTPTVKPTTPKVDPAPKPFSFAGFGSNAGTTIGGNASSTFSFGGFGSSLGNSAAPKAANVTTAEATSVPAAVAIPSTAAAGIASPTNISKSKPIVPAVTAAPPALGEQDSGIVVAPAVSTSNADPTENAFRSINICKPQVKEKAADAPPANIFSGFAANTASFQSGEASKGIFGGAADGGSKTAATIASPAVTTAALPVATTAPAIATSTTTSSLAVPTTTTAIVSTVAATVQPTFGASVAPAVTTSAVSSAAPGISFSFSNAFSNLGSPSAPAAATPLATPTTGATTASNTSSSIFGGGNAFASTTGTGASPFQAAPTSTAAAPPPTNLFGSVPKPEASVFGGATTAAAPPPSGLFAAAAASTSPSTFGGSPAAAPAASAASSGGNIFGQAAAAVKPGGFGSPAPSATSVGGSIFGGASSTAASPFGGTSIFGSGSTAQSPPPAAGSTGGSIFGQSVFGSAAPASGGNLFSTSSAAPATGFGGGSVFGGSPANATSPNANSGSIFGGGNSSGGFGSFAQTTPAAGGFGSGFAQSTGGSVAQSGFGSPQPQNPQSPAGGFGAKPVFGGSPAFGASPTFGGAPTFGSPKGFGTFGNSPNVIAPPAFGGQPKPAEGNIFETLGGADTSLSFGNLAQTGNTNTQKSTFGGSSFMTYR